MSQLNHDQEGCLNSLQDTSNLLPLPAPAVMPPNDPAESVHPKALHEVEGVSALA